MASGAVVAAAAGVATGSGRVGALGEGRLYIASIVGRRAAPKGVERKSVGRSMGRFVRI